MSSLQALEAVVATCFILLSVIVMRYNQVRSKALPPGPRADFLGLGDNRSQMARMKSHAWKIYSEWAKQYGPLFTYRLGGTPVIVIGTAKIAWDLLEKRGDIYSSRPREVMAQELLSGNMRGIGMRYGDQFRKWRKIQHLGMSGRQAITYKPMQTFESSLLMREIVHNPDADPSLGIQRFATSIVFSISYGTRIKSLDEQDVKDNTDAVVFAVRYMCTIRSTKYGSSDQVLFLRQPGAYLVNSYPSLLWLPRPLQWFRYEPERLKAWSEQLYLRLLREVRKKMQKGISMECICSRVLSPGKDMGMTETELAWAASAPFTAGVETTKSAILTFILAMLLYPQVAKKAQEELDDVVGPDRMPTFDDETKLPYVGALLKEVLRWRPVAPTGVAHSVTQDDYYEGFFIPKGSTLYTNLRDITHDPELFYDPDDFRPERFLDTNNPRLVDFTLPFGFGRRICPGMHVASQSLWIIMARSLWAFDILHALNEDGKPILPDPDNYVGKLVVQPAPFTCRFVPRKPDVVSVIESEALDADVKLRAWD